MSRIPIVDLEKIGEIPANVAQNENWISVAQEVRRGLGDIGFIYLTNHGVDKSVILNAFSETKKFFNLPQEVKLKYKKGGFADNFDNYVGYTEPGDELLHPSSRHELRETFDFIEAVGVYPDAELPHFNVSFIELRNQCKILTRQVLLLWAISLKLDDTEFFLNRITHMDDLSAPRAMNMRALHYPPIPDDMEVPSGTVRLGEHSDYALLTFLFQDTIGGLEVQTVDGKWVAATPIPDTILVNTGDLLEFWSAGIFPATKHRVVVPENEALKRAERYSIAYFLAPNVDTVVSPLKVKKTETEVKRLAAGNTLINYDEMEPVVSMEYVMNRLTISYSKK